VKKKDDRGGRKEESWRGEKVARERKGPYGEKTPFLERKEHL